MKWFVGAFIFFLSILLLLAIGSSKPGEEAFHPVKVGLLGQGEEGSLPYEGVLREEGFPWARLGEEVLRGSRVEDLVALYPTLILPEGQALSEESFSLLKDYVEKGGQLLWIYDAGLHCERGKKFLAEMAGAVLEGEGRPHEGYWRFLSPEAPLLWGITPGKTDEEWYVTSYGYGRLKYRHLPIRAEGAEVVADEGQGCPVILVKSYPRGGKVFYINAPLGFYKYMSDDLPFRSVLRTFLIKVARLPKVVNTPQGKGCLVFNLHVDSNAHIRPLGAMLREGIFRRGLEYSIHITAGPDIYRPGDGCGFDAEGKGRPWVELLQKYGAIGSHGGWIHNYFAEYLEVFPREQVWYYLARNREALSSITGKPVLEYSAPVGHHPPFVNRWLEEHGIVAYYSPGHTGSSPTRSFLQGQQISGRLWSFPVTPYREYACLEELMAARVPLEEVKAWYGNLMGFIEKERVARLIYTHPNAGRYALEALKYLSERMDKGRRQGRLLAWSMSRVADFLSRHEKTEMEFRRSSSMWRINLKNPEGLRDITVALYVGDHPCRVLGSHLKYVREGEWLYVTVTGAEAEKEIVVKILSPRFR